MKNIFKVFTDYQQFQLLILGMLSGIPLGILYSTLFAWLTDEKIDLSIITSFAIARIFYTLKVLWAPFFDHIKVPFLAHIGHRKSWMVVCTSIITLIIFNMSKIDPNESLSQLFILVVILGFTSATFDIVFDAFRIEKMDKSMQAIGAANTTFGYRIGCLITGAGAFYWSEWYGWHSTFSMLSAIYFMGTLYIITLKEEKIIRPEFNSMSLNSWKMMVIDPFLDFMQRRGAILILLAIIFFKLGEALLGVVATPFYLKLGFTKSEIASVVKVYGLLATLLGVYAGGYLTYSLGYFKALVITGILQSITNFSFIWLNHMGHDIYALATAITIENIGSGMGSAALVGYLSIICNKKFSATQYALFSGASGLFSHTIVSYGGTLVKQMGWDAYFMLTIILAIPGVIMFYYLNKIYGDE